MENIFSSFFYVRLNQAKNWSDSKKSTRKQNFERIRRFFEISIKKHAMVPILSVISGVDWFKTILLAADLPDSIQVKFDPQQY